MSARRGPGTDPELAVPGVAEELLGVAPGQRAEVEDRLVACRRRGGSSTSTASGSRSLPSPVRWAKALCGRKT